MTTATQGSSSPTRFAWLSIAAAVLTIGMKYTAYVLTGSVGLLSDTLESFVNLAGALIALTMLTIAARPADEEHMFGHGKAEYFSSGAEGVLIFLAAVSIGVTSIPRILAPQPLEQVGLGLGVSVMASLVNFFVARALARAAERFRSITLEADAKHLMTDVWTSAGVLVGVGAVAVTGWEILDPIVALAVAANIIWSGIGIVRGSVRGLMDTAIAPGDQAILQNALGAYGDRGIEIAELRTRQSGAHQFASFHARVPGSWSVQQGHALVGEIEADIRRVLPSISVLIHLEPGGAPR